MRPGPCRWSGNRSPSVRGPRARPSSAGCRPGFAPMLPGGAFEPFPTSGQQQGLRNIVGVLPGRAPAILIGAHYDTEYRPEGLRRGERQRGRDGGPDRARPRPAVGPAGGPPRDPLRPLRRGGGPARLRRPQLPVLRAAGVQGLRSRPPGPDRRHDPARLHRQPRGAVPAGGELEPGSLGAAPSGGRRRSGRRTSSRTRPRTPIIDDHIPFLDQRVPSIDLIDCPTRTRTRTRTRSTSSTQPSSAGSARRSSGSSST